MSSISLQEIKQYIALAEEYCRRIKACDLVAECELRQADDKTSLAVCVYAQGLRDGFQAGRGADDQGTARTPLGLYLCVAAAVLFVAAIGFALGAVTR